MLLSFIWFITFKDTSFSNFASFWDHALYGKNLKNGIFQKGLERFFSFSGFKVYSNQYRKWAKQFPMDIFCLQATIKDRCASWPFTRPFHITIALFQLHQSIKMKRCRSICVNSGFFSKKIFLHVNGTYRVKISLFLGEYKAKVKSNCEEAIFWSKMQIFKKI